ncbi:hypothetical protein OCHUTO_0391 [Orientia chuto str. Dubai]|uniref:DUF2660 domain-containing protein n=1 Tax=Orientia chuto str. Dubai TaxID=1359168 RepID=A0A0F3MMH4_9RICK|nr:DUF2660 domain-containing protein [Candidatus Orientia mediorientalis]KJV56647.1 hypothetical protein OCHUTO_0391 [Orientia chuto str. Dubai]
MLNYLVIILFAIIVVYLVLYKIRKYKPNKHEYVQRGDEQAQNKYAQARTSIQKLSLKQLTEMSWQFLYDITKTILKRFSYEDQQKVIKIGSKLHEIGVRYEHQITNTVNHQPHQNVTVEKTTNRGKSH